MTFPARLRELIAKATKGPWRFVEREALEDKSVYPRHIVGGSNDLQVLVMETLHCAKELNDDLTKFPELNAYQLANANLITYLVNHAPALAELVEAAENHRCYKAQCGICKALAKLNANDANDGGKHEISA